MSPAARTNSPKTTRSERRLRRLLITALLPSPRHIDHRAQRDSGAERNEKQRPRIAVRQSEKMKMCELKPHAGRDEPHAGPHRIAAEKMRHAKGDDDQRPVLEDQIAEVFDVESIEQKEDSDRDQHQTIEQSAAVEFFVHDVLRLISIPPMNAAPRTMSCFCGSLTGPVRISNPAINGTTSPMTSHPSGT